VQELPDDHQSPIEWVHLSSGVGTFSSTEGWGASLLRRDACKKSYSAPGRHLSPAVSQASTPASHSTLLSLA
jgi:hypothetical protein